SLCEALNSCRLDATCIARCFVDNTSGFDVYTSYCTGYPRTMERLAALASVEASAREFREIQLELGHLLPLASYLLKPVQRILKYHLLLQNVVKQCASRETEYALLKMTGIAQHIDDMKRRHEHAVRVQEIQSLLYGWNGPDLTTYGELCAEGTFSALAAPQERMDATAEESKYTLQCNMMLVESIAGAPLSFHVIPWDAPRAQLTLQARSPRHKREWTLLLKRCNMMLVESIAGAPLSFHVIPWDAPRAQLTLQARSPRHKREWTLLLKRVMQHDAGGVDRGRASLVPRDPVGRAARAAHAASALAAPQERMDATAKENDMLAEKSHNLITQASMRKQLSAPEYLEKRKIDRERRKTFENGIRGRMKKNRKHTLTNTRSDTQDCDCSQVSAEKGIDYTCDNCYIDLCSDCETDLNKDKVVEEKCSCKHDDREITGDKCPDCDKALHYIDSGSAEHLERKPPSCKCSDFKSSQESFGKEFGGTLNKTRGYHSSDNIISYTEKNDSELTVANNSLNNVRNIPKTCLKCAKIKENIVITDTLRVRSSRCNDNERRKADSLTRSKSKDDPQRSKLSKIGTWRRKSEPGLQQNMIGIINKKSQESDSERSDAKGTEKIEFECRNCGTNKITRKVRANDGTIISDPELEGQKRGGNPLKSNLEIRMYNTKNIPKKISKIKKNRAKGLRLGSDTTAKFYADLSSDVSTENILHISESNDSLNVDKPKETKTTIPDTVSKDESMDEETYRKLIEKTDSFKKNELEKVKYLNKQKVITEGSEVEDKLCEVTNPEEVTESCEEAEQPLEQIISQLLLQNREFQKLVKKQQLRNSAQRRHQRLMKSHSNPEHVIVAKLDAMKPKFGRQTSENIDVNIEKDVTDRADVQADATTTTEEDHIYEILRVDNRVDESLHSLNTKSKVIQHTHLTRPKRLPSPPNPPNIMESPTVGPDSDYVYLSFDQLDKLPDTEGIYDVPVKSPQKVESRVSNEYYVDMESQSNIPSDANIYDSLLEVCRRKKDLPDTLPSEYLPMGSDQQSPNTPEIWLSRQKEHFNVSRDRKSGSLPRSFQVVTGQDEDNLSTFKCKPNSNNKTYVNRDGKVKSTDRPYTIASDQSEISYDDVESYMSEGDILKFNKSSKSETDYAQNISQSTLDLEEEIDRCYKNNFERVDNLDKNKNETLLNISHPNLDTSMTSSFEVLSTELIDDKPVEIEVIHPEHKIYKPTSNMLSLKYVLSKFKNKTPTKTEEAEINANDPSSPDSTKSDVKSPSNEKRSALNPRSYSKNLLQRFRSIIGDEHADNNENRSQSPVRTQKSTEDVQNSLTTSEIKVVITSTDASPTTSTIVYTVNSELLSKSVCEQSSTPVSQHEKNDIEPLSLSCDNITQKQSFRPAYGKTVSVISNISNSSLPLKSNINSHQSLNKLPIYMQGSKHLGARIAQSDYVDPSTLVSEKSALKNINILINKNAVRPDSLFSNSSFVTSSSEGTYLECQKKTISHTESKEKAVTSTQMASDESFYEKSFEKIEQVTDGDVFRDSAVYSDQEDDESKTEAKAVKPTRTECLRQRPTFKSHITHSTTVSERSNVLTRMTVINKTHGEITNTVNAKTEAEIAKAKTAPPVPAKPRLSQIPSTSTFQTRQLTSKSSNKIETSSSSESVNTKTIKRNTNYKQPVLRSESSPNESKTSEVNENKQNSYQNNKSNYDKKNNVEQNGTQEDISANKYKYPGNIQMKRLSFERASLDSATRKIKTTEMKRPNEPPKTTSKSVFERRMEIESMSKTKPSQLKKPTQVEKPKSITTKVAGYERSMSEGKRDSDGKREMSITPSSSTERANIPSNRSSISAESNDDRASWVKQVVNKFQ
ncbi:putative Pleckstrin-like proteiny domain-containing family G member 1, partial [Operophtera brumata]